MGSVGVPPAAEQYFIKCTSLSNRLIQDINYVKEVNRKWNRLSYPDQCKAIDEGIINRSDASSKYHFYLTEEPEIQYYPKLMLQTGEKYVLDEENGKLTGFRWRDEHSAPFSWETKSQQNLSYSSMECLAEDDEAQTSSTEVTDTTSTMESQKPPDSGFSEVKTRNIQPKTEERVSIFGSGFDPPELVLGGSSTALLSELKVRLGEKLTSNTYNAGTTSSETKPSLLAKGKKLFLRMNLKRPKRKENAQFSYDLPSSQEATMERENKKPEEKRADTTPKKSKKPRTPVIKPKSAPPPPPKPKHEPPPRPEPPRRDPNTELSTKLCGSRSSLFSKGTENREEAVCLLPDRTKAEIQPRRDSRMSTSSDGGNFSLEMSTPEEDEEDIPKTGFAFLDNW